jgi:hypothetical protein
MKWERWDVDHQLLRSPFNANVGRGQAHLTDVMESLTNRRATFLDIRNSRVGWRDGGISIVDGHFDRGIVALRA